jgi:hypothetical protein
MFAMLHALSEPLPASLVMECELEGKSRGNGFPAGLPLILRFSPDRFGRDSSIPRWRTLILVTLRSCLKGCATFPVIYAVFELIERWRKYITESAKFNRGIGR